MQFTGTHQRISQPPSSKLLLAFKELSPCMVMVLLIVIITQNNGTAPIDVGIISSASMDEAQQHEGLAEMSPKERNLSPHFEPFRIENEPQVHGEAVRPNCEPEPAEKYIYNNLTTVINGDQPKFLSTYLFPDLSHGVFVEAGAANHLASNTFGFEENRCWTGLCVEPTEKFYQQLVENRVNCYLINGALGSKNRVRQFWDVEGSAWFSGFAETISEHKRELIKKEGWNHSVIDVQTYILHELLASHGMWHVDLWSLDCEGCEMEVLESFRFDIITVDAILVEMDGDGVKEEIISFLEGSGYEFVACAAHDGVFLRRHSDRYRKVRANLPPLEATCAE